MEGAQRFLTLNLPARFTVGYNGRSIEVARISEPEAPNPCWTRFRERLDNGVEASAGIAWRIVLEVRHAEGSSAVRLLNRNGHEFTYDFGSEALAARAAFAMEFLRQGCDPSASTGF